jgi:predicted RNase H-like nuclease (RuvC/YqgF family)
MFEEIPQQQVLIIAGVFLFGWLLSSISSSISSNGRSRKRDPKDDRIRSLEAELRIAQSDAESSKEKAERLEEELEEANNGNEKRDNVISHQQQRIDKMKAELRDSVMKTRELRAELSERATENLRSEVKLREVETELEVAQASTDLIATGVLDYSVAPQADDNEEVESIFSVATNSDDEEIEDLLSEDEMTKAAN